MLQLRSREAATKTRHYQINIKKEKSNRIKSSYSVHYNGYKE